MGHHCACQPSKRESDRSVSTEASNGVITLAAVGRLLTANGIQRGRFPTTWFPAPSIASWAKDFKVIDQSSSRYGQPSISRHSQEGLGMDQSSNDVSTPVAGQFALPLRATFGLGDRVRKKSGAAWQGQVVGWYCTKLTPEGYAVESESHPGSVQIYPVAALERVA